jgi:hypothetical protein
MTVALLLSVHSSFDSSLSLYSWHFSTSFSKILIGISVLRHRSRSDRPAHLASIPQLSRSDFFFSFFFLIHFDEYFEEAFCNFEKKKLSWLMSAGRCSNRTFRAGPIFSVDGRRATWIFLSLP